MDRSCAKNNINICESITGMEIDFGTGRMADGGAGAADGSSPLFSVDAGKGFVQSAKSRIALIRRGRDWTVQHQPKPCS